MISSVELTPQMSLIMPSPSPLKIDFGLESNELSQSYSSLLNYEEVQDEFDLNGFNFFELNNCNSFSNFPDDSNQENQTLGLNLDLNKIIGSELEGLNINYEETFDLTPSMQKVSDIELNLEKFLEQESIGDLSLSSDIKSTFSYDLDSLLRKEMQVDEKPKHLKEHSHSTKKSNLLLRSNPISLAKNSNKEAAIKYRSKKQMQKAELFSQCELYANKNSVLKQKIEDLQTEISLIKSLLVQALLAKNNIEVDPI